MSHKTTNAHVDHEIRLSLRRLKKQNSVYGVDLSAVEQDWQHCRRRTKKRAELEIRSVRLSKALADFQRIAKGFSLGMGVLAAMPKWNSSSAVSRQNFFAALFAFLRPHEARLNIFLQSFGAMSASEYRTIFRKWRVCQRELEVYTVADVTADNRRCRQIGKFLRQLEEMAAVR